jgi:perosamine synthetase
MSIPVHKPSIKRSDMDAVLTCMVSDNLSPGVLSHRLAHEVAHNLGAESGLAVREYQRAVEAAIDGLGISAGGRIVLTPLCPRIYERTFKERAIELVMVDVDPENGCITSGALEALEGQNVDAVVCHYPLGFVPNMEAIMGFGVPIIEDISQAFGALTGTRKAGSYGQYVIISLEAENIITSGGGALVLGRSKKEATALKRVGEAMIEEQLLPDMNAALGLTQIKELEKFIERRKEIAQHYGRSLLQSRHKTLVQRGEAENTYFSFPVLIEMGLKDVQAFARKKAIETAPAFANSILALMPGEEAAGRELTH